jgi:hypothetical protein
MLFHSGAIVPPRFHAAIIAGSATAVIFLKFVVSRGPPQASLSCGSRTSSKRGGLQGHHGQLSLLTVSLLTVVLNE